MHDFVIKFHDDLKRWAHTRTWYWYVPAWLLFAYIYMYMLTKDGRLPPLFNIFETANFGVHEIAHEFTSGMGDTINAASGSLSEILLAWGFVFGALQVRQYFTSMMMFIWVTFSSLSTARYMNDARARELDLVSVASALGVGAPSDNLHDWEVVFTNLGILQYDTAIGGFFFGSGVVLGALGLGVGVWMIYQMTQEQEERIVEQYEDPIEQYRAKNIAKAAQQANGTQGGVKNEHYELTEADKMVLEAYNTGSTSAEANDTDKQS